MSKRKAVMIASMALAVVCSALWTAAQEKPRTRTETKLVMAEELGKMELERAKAEATPIQEGVVTTQQKEHQKLYKKYSQVGMRLRDCSAYGTRDIFFQRGGGSGEYNPNPIDLQKVFQEMAVNADAVIIGVVKDKSSQFTENEDFIFTDYEISIDEVLKSNLVGQLKTEKRIIVTRPGGTVLANGHLVEAVDEDFLLLHKGLQYLLFLKYIPPTGAYQALDSRSSFLLFDYKVSKLTKEDFPFESYFNRGMVKPLPGGDSGVDAASFIELVRSAIASVSEGSHGGVK